MDLLADFRYAWRIVSRSPLFVVAIIIVLALAVAANTVVFSEIDAIFLRPPPYLHPDRLATFSQRVSFPELNGLQAATRSFESLTGYQIVHADATIGGITVRDVLVCQIAGDVFKTLGVTPASGRLFTPRELVDNSHVAILSYSARHLITDSGGALNISARNIKIGDVPYTVIGTMSKEFVFPLASAVPKMEIWVPIPQTAAMSSAINARMISSVGRLYPGIALHVAQDEVRAVDARFAGSEVREKAIDLLWLRRQIDEDTKTGFLALMGAVGFVLLIACANIGMLLLSRAANRHKEMAVRVALGASPKRIVRQLLIEALVLGVSGGTLGLLLAEVTLRLLDNWTPRNLSYVPSPAIDLSLLVFVAAISVGTGILFGLLPALELARTDVLSSLGGWTPAPGVRGSMRAAPLIVEVAATLVLLIGACLLVQTLARLWSVPLGFSDSNLLVGVVDLPPSKYPDAERWQVYWMHLVEQIRALPGTEDASIVNALPFWGYSTMNIQRVPAHQEGWFSSQALMVGPRYFSTTKIQLMRGRDFTESEASDSPSVVIINQAMHRKLWPSEATAVGKRIVLATSAAGRAAEVIGEVADVQQGGLTEPAQPTVYLPYAQFPGPAATLVVRTASSPSTMIRTVAAIIRRTDSNVAFSDVTTMREVISDSLAPQQFASIVLVTFAGLAMVLAVTGVFALTAYIGASRTREIGIRIAVGASHTDICRLILRQSMLPVVAGIAIGSVVSVLFNRVLAGLLFGVRPTDPITIISCSMVLFVTSCSAGLIPARHATKVDPVVALRS
jgi:predicted permease